MKGYETYLGLFVIALFVICTVYIAFLIHRNIAVQRQILMELRAHDYKLARINEHLHNIDNDMYFINDYCKRRGGNNETIRHS